MSIEEWSLIGSYTSLTLESLGSPEEEEMTDLDLLAELGVTPRRFSCSIASRRSIVMSLLSDRSTLCDKASLVIISTKSSRASSFPKY